MKTGSGNTESQMAHDDDDEHGTYILYIVWVLGFWNYWIQSKVL